MKIPEGSTCQAKRMRTVGKSFDMYFCGEPATIKIGNQYLCQKHYAKRSKQNDNVLVSVEIDGYIWASMCVKLGLPKDASVADMDEAIEKLVADHKQASLALESHTSKNLN
jgi:hypothetical protein